VKAAVLEQAEGKFAGGDYIGTLKTAAPPSSRGGKTTARWQGEQRGHHREVATLTKAS